MFRVCPRAVQRRLLTLAVVAAALLAAPGLAQAQTTHINEKTPFGGIVANGCNGEAVVWEGFQHIVATFRPQGNGVHVNLMIDFTGQGVGQTTGRKYTFGSKHHTNQKTSSSSSFMYTRDQTKCVSQGKTDNMFIIAVFRVNPSGKTVDKEPTIQCRG
jgi:hypothetical protein